MSDNSRRILLVCWHFPPSSEVAGKITWRLARHLAFAGCDVHVLLPPITEISDLDENYAREVPANLRITRTSVGVDPIRTLVAWRQRLGARRRAGKRNASAPAPAPAAAVDRTGLRYELIEAFQRLPDRARHWRTPAARALRRILRDERPDVVISVAPMLTAHLLVADANPRRFGVRWLAWSHDPDMLNPYLTLPGWRNRLVAAWEKQALSEADRLLVTTRPMVDAYARQLPGSATPMLLPCGYDPDELGATGSTSRPGARLVIAHVGTVYGHRSPHPLLESLSRLVASGEVQAGDILLRFIGKMENAAGMNLRQRVRELGIDPLVDVQGPVSQAGALEAIRDAHIGLVLAEGQPLQVPAKLYEYVGLRRPVLALGDGATTDLVSELGIGFSCSRDTLDATLREMIAAWRNDRFAGFHRSLGAAAARYSMPAIAADLLDFIDAPEAGLQPLVAAA